MIDTNYKIGALEYLLDKECLPEKYYPLIPLKHNLILRSRGTGYQTKNDLEVLSDAELSSFGLSEESLLGLLRRFLKLYDPKSQKFREIEKFDLSEKEILAYRELYCLPGVRQTRASLYYLSGYKTLSDIADADPEDVLEKTAQTISSLRLSCTVPLPKEVRTHIAVAKAFTGEGNIDGIRNK